MGENKKHNEIITKSTVFFAGILLTCVVGIVELLPEFDNITGKYGLISLSALYFVFLFGIFFGLTEFFYILDKNKTESDGNNKKEKDDKNDEKKIGIDFSRIEFFNKYAPLMKYPLYITLFLIFITLYLVKIGYLK